MEHLPELVIRNIAKYLSVKDLGACCSTSTSWRVVFNQDHVWRPFCDQLMASHLKVTECQVEPGFVSPEPEDSSLSPICEWRLSYMREVHLWNNWSWDRYKEDLIGSNSEMELQFRRFIDNNQLLIKFKNEKRVMLWDVNKTSTHLYDPVTLQFDVDIKFCEIIEDTIFFVQLDTIQKYKINHCTTQAWELQGIYKLSSPVNEIFTQSNVLVVRNQENILEIFDLKRCETVKMTKMPRELTNGLKVRSVTAGGKGSMHFTVLLDCTRYVEVERDNSVELAVKNSILIYVYSIKKLDFIDFNIIISVSGYRDDELFCSVYEEFLIVFNNGSIKIYKYLTSELIIDAPNKFPPIAAIYLPPKDRLPFLSVYGKNVGHMFEHRSVLLINSHLYGRLYPLVSRYFKYYDIARLLQHVRKYSALPEELDSVGQFEYYINTVINNVFTKFVNEFGRPYVLTLW